MNDAEKISWGRDLTDDYDLLIKDVFPAFQSKMAIDSSEAWQIWGETVELFKNVKGYSEDEFTSLMDMVYHDSHDLKCLRHEEKLGVDKFLKR
jgi:hypothetical protein